VAIRDFVEAATAYDTLMDDKAREIYDRFGPSALPGYPEYTVSDFSIAWVKMMTADRAISL
jgi:DnaJ-class molecular chaperone